MSRTRTERWTWDLLDLNDQVIRTLSTVDTGGVLEGNVNADIRWGGRFAMHEDEWDIDWLKVRLRPVYHDLTTEVELPWGLYIPVVPQTDFSPTGRSWSGTIVDKTSILAGSGPVETYSVAPGTNITNLVMQIIREQADDRIACTQSDVVTTGMMTWSTDATWLRIVNDLLDAAGYFAVWCDRWGQWRVEPYSLPSDRLVKHVFEPGPESVHLPRFARVQDEMNVPNRVRCVGQASGDDPPLIGVAVNENPESRYSVQQRGRVIETRYDNVEATDQATLTGIAQRRLVEASSPGLTVEDVRHAVMDLWTNDVVSFNDSGVRQERATVEKMTVTCRPGQLVSTTLRGVAVL